MPLMSSMLRAGHAVVEEKTWLQKGSRGACGDRLGVDGRTWHTSDWIMDKWRPRDGLCGMWWQEVSGFYLFCQLGLSWFWWPWALMNWRLRADKESTVFIRFSTMKKKPYLCVVSFFFFPSIENSPDSGCYLERYELKTQCMKVPRTELAL